MTVVIAIDVGLTGAMARVGGNLPPMVEDLPTLPDGEPKAGKNNGSIQPKRLDGRGVAELLRKFCPPDEKAVVIIENIRPRPNPTRGTSIVTEGSLMRSRGVIEAAVEIQRMELKTVEPQTWKRFYGLLSTDKKLAIDKARMLFPGLADSLTRQMDHNRADAALIANWAQRTMA